MKNFFTYSRKLSIRNVMNEPDFQDEVHILFSGTRLNYEDNESQSYSILLEVSPEERITQSRVMISFAEAALDL